MAWICDKTGQQKCEIKKLSYNGVFMDVSSITVTVESAVPIAFAIGDYIDWDYDGLRYTLDAAAGVEKQARKQTVGNAFVYDNLVFLSPLKAADNAEFLDVIIGNTNEFLTNTEFSFYGTAWDYAKRLEANLCRMYGDGSWKVRIWTGGTCYDETPATGIDTGSWENKLVDVSGIKCLVGFQQIYDLWGCAYVFSVNNGVNYVDFYDDFEQYAQAWKESGVDKIFAYGKGNGLYKIRHTQDTDHVLVTRLRPYGSSDNLPANYYLNSPDYHVDGNESSELAISRLMLPASQWTKNGVKQPANAYLEQNTDLYGVREASVCWDGSDPELGEIKPTIYNLTIQDLLDLMASGTTYRPNTAKWPDASQRIDKIITGASPTDNGAVAEAGYDFTVVESNGALSAHEFGVMRVNKVVDFSDLVMGTTPSISHLAEFRIAPTSSNTVAVSFDVPDTVVSAISLVTAYLTPYVGNEKVSDATFPCAVSHEDISVTEDGVHYTRRYKIRLLDSAENPIVFSTMLTGQVAFRIYAEIHFISGREPDASIPVIRTEYAVAFNLLRGNKAIDKFFSVTIPQVGFDLAAAVTSGARLCMRSGANQPREFQIVPSSVRYVESSDTWYFRCKRSLDQSISTYFPNSDSVIAAGDEFYFSGIAMPALYVEIAAQKLLTAATAWLALHSKPRMLSSVDVDNKIMAKESIVLKEGMSLPLSDTDLGITPQNQESRIIDNIRIEEGSDSIRTFSITLRDKKEKSSLDQAIRGATSNFATNTSVAEAIGAVDNRDHGSLSGRDMPNQHPISSITGLEEALAALSFFEKDGNGNIKLKDEYGGLWTAGFMTAGGIGSGGSGGGGLVEQIFRVDDFGGTFDKDGNDTFNAYAINTLHERILALELHPGGVTSVAGLTGAISATALYDALGLNTEMGIIGKALQSLQSQVDSIATKDCFDEIVVSSVFVDCLAASSIYVGESDLGTVKSGVWNGSKIANDYLVNKTIGVGSAVITLGSSATLSQIGIPTWAQKAQLEFTDMPVMYVARTQVKGTAGNDTMLGITAISNAASSDATDASRIEWDATNNAWHFIGNLYADGFIAAGGVGSTSGGGVDLDRVWQSLTNEVADDYANTLIDTHHIPDMASVYGYLKVNQVITLTGVVTGSGSTTISTSIADGALTIAKTSGLQTALDAKQATISDLDTIRNNASNGETAYGWGNHANAGYLTSANGTTISEVIQSLQAQIDSVASRDNFDEIIASAAFVDTLAASVLYAGSIDLGGSDLSTSLTNINGKISTLEGYFDASGNAKSALKLTTVSKTIWGVTYWTQNGVPDNVTGRPNLFIGTTQVQTSSATQALTGITTGAFSSYVTVGGTLGVTGLVTAASGLKLSTTKKIWFGDDYYIELVNIAESGETPIYAIHSNAGFYSDSFITAGGIATSGDSGTIDLDRLWQSLTNEVADDYSETLIATAHIPDMAQIYSYVKTSAISDMATKTWVASQGYVSSADLDVVDLTIRSLQAQIDSVASIWDGDEICTIALYADSVSSFDLYVTNVHLGDKTLTETSTIVTINGITVALGGSMSTASITAGTAGTSSSTSGTTISIPYVTMNQYGIVTGYGTHSHTISAANIVSALGNTAVNRATADASGNTITTTYITVSRLDSDELTLAAALESLQSQIDAVASRNDFDEIIATVVDSDTISAQNGYFVALSGSLSGNATTASYLVGSSYGVGSASLPVYFSGGLPVACTASSLFSGLSSSAGTNLSITIAGQNRTATLYATYDSASENISSTFGSVSTYLQSLQAQIDSVAAARSFDELTITSLYADTLSVGANVIIGGTTHSVGGIDSESYITAGAAYTSSDKRLKDDIKSVSASRAWAVLMALSPSEWTWNDKNDYLSGKQGAGLVAQDVSDVLPFSVLDFGDYLSLNYSVFHAYEIAGLQDHERRIKQLEKENKELKAKLNIY